MVLSDIEIANSVQMKPITDIAAELGLTEDDISLYGKYKAKIDSNQLEQLKDKEDGKLILTDTCWRRKDNHLCWLGRCSFSYW